MPLKEVAAQLEQFRTLLRDGRINDADIQALELRKSIENELIEAKKLEPPPTPKETSELLMAALEEISAVSGNHPRLRAILAELKPKLWPEKPAEESA